MRGHNICFSREIRKIIFDFIPFLSGVLPFSLLPPIPVGLSSKEFWKNMIRHLLFNPSALRAAKTLWSCGCSECNRVKEAKRKSLVPLCKVAEKCVPRHLNFYDVMACCMFYLMHFVVHFTYFISFLTREIHLLDDDSGISFLKKMPGHGFTKN